jgi:hypothetical protein
MGWMMPLFVRYWLYADNLATLRGTEHDQKGLLHACFCEICLDDRVEVHLRVI